MKIKNILFIIIMSCSLSVNSELKANEFYSDSRSPQALNVLSDMANLAAEFGLTPVQKIEIKQILFDYLPSLGFKANSLLKNRSKLIEMNLKNEGLDEQKLHQIANEQGNTLTEMIVLKEHMKQDLRNVLTEEQIQFIDDLLRLLIQSRMNSF